MHIEDFPQSIDNVRVPNVIMLGKTGAGKSFFGSGLFGAEDPDKGISSSGKLGCVVKMVVDSILPHAESGLNGHRKDASPFIYI